MRTYIHEFIVEGTGHFPTDMLRYDGCYPATQEDVTKLDWEVHDGLKPRRITLRCRGAKESGPSVERWKSFGWPVVNQLLPRLL